jgi:uncharacterized membrane protein YagU involved in acid resistance|tara:strand:+ start:1592 stop:2032 length:441 start_codon:yes stop_codon:yes gene_type:complete
MLSRAARGAVAGATATVPMTAVFVAARAAGAYDTLPPTEILERLAGPTRRRRRTRPVDRWSMVLHVAFGAGAGAAFAVLAPGARGRRAVLGPVWGVLVWLASYEGWLPIAGILPPAHRDHPPRARAIAIAHLVWGMGLGLLTRRRD